MGKFLNLSDEAIRKAARPKEFIIFRFVRRSLERRFPFSFCELGGIEKPQLNAPFSPESIGSRINARHEF